MEIDESNPTVTLEDNDSLQSATLEAELKDTAAIKTEHMEESMKADETNINSRKSAKDISQETSNLSAKPKVGTLRSMRRSRERERERGGGGRGQDHYLFDVRCHQRCGHQSRIISFCRWAKSI